jgi:hypothetical protein
VTVHMPQYGIESLLPFYYISHSVVSKNVCIENSIMISWKNIVVTNVGWTT